MRQLLLVKSLWAQLWGNKPIGNRTWQKPESNEAEILPIKTAAEIIVLKTAVIIYNLELEKPFWVQFKKKKKKKKYFIDFT